MKTLIQSPLGKLSKVPEVHINLEMTGAQYDLLSISDINSYTSVVLSVLKDLMEEDPYQLTYMEMYYLFLMVKCSSLGPSLTLNLECHNKTDHGVCGAKNTFSFGLNESDLKRVPEDYEPKHIKLTMLGLETEYIVLPPTMKYELQIIEYFASKGIGLDKLGDINNKQLILEYSRHRMSATLHTLEGDPAFPTDASREQAVKSLISENSVKSYKELANLVAEVVSYGVENKEYKINCKECGGLMKFRLPLQAGISL